MRKNIFILGLFIILASTILWGCGSKNVVASVNGEDITVQELDEQVALMKTNLEQQGFSFEGDQGKELEQMLRQNLVDQMIDQKLVLQDAEKKGMMPSDKEVQDQIDEIKKQLGTEADFKKYLAANGVNETKLNDLFRQQLAMNNLQEKIVSEVPEPTDEQIKAYYEQNKTQFSQPEQRQVSHILIGVGDYSNGQKRSEVDAKVLALQVVQKIKAGEDFAELAKKYSDDQGSKDNGGQYPAFSKGSGFVEEFEDTAFNLKQGEYTVEPVKTTFGYHIIRLDEIIPAKTQTLEESKDSIISSLNQDAVNQKTDEYLKSLRDKAKIVNNVEKDQPEQADKDDKDDSTKK
ncbi:peptidyl-prolyl cis-trans isomerase C [Desulfotomaculum arcticum]|uniref:peptidylprolyl isomerase n=1 Tax=Desulfotruncus arcticus DSM 17038 TaxID=1121424 RepID=A0A1I2WG41_9FIRM|nr:peptidylprolyl isomerase [Desulfotruncus arcticus]SFG99709.1 peptidyl-prolyl cis-trans isomerase C [Desulfotomaculum arcticum] [Desulfotruncus arcticus DSM 17038]